MSDLKRIITFVCILPNLCYTHTTFHVACRRMSTLPFGEDTDGSQRFVFTDNAHTCDAELSDFIVGRIHFDRAIGTRTRSDDRK